MKNYVNESARDFSGQTHGSSDYWQDNVYVCGDKENEFIPLSMLVKNNENIEDIRSLQNIGYAISSLTYLELTEFDDWYNNVFNRKLSQKLKKTVNIVHLPDMKEIFKAVEIVDQVFYGKQLTDQATHTIHLGTIREEEHIIDEVLVSIFKTPKSYTKENVAEISCHGSNFIIQKFKGISSVICSC